MLTACKAKCWPCLGESAMNITKATLPREYTHAINRSKHQDTARACKLRRTEHCQFTVIQTA